MSGQVMANSVPRLRPRLYIATDGHTVMTVVSLISGGTTPEIGCTSGGAVAVDIPGQARLQVRISKVEAYQSRPRPSSGQRGPKSLSPASSGSHNGPAGDLTCYS